MGDRIDHDPSRGGANCQRGYGTVNFPGIPCLKPI
jgi:hypothetical protein